LNKKVWGEREKMGGQVTDPSPLRSRPGQERELHHDSEQKKTRTEGTNKIKNRSKRGGQEQ